MQRIRGLIMLLQGFGIKESLPGQTLEDNLSCIVLCLSERNSTSTKHIGIRNQYEKILQGQGVIELHYCPTEKITTYIYQATTKRKISSPAR